MPKILLVEDDHTISRLYGTKLELDGYEVIYAYNGLEAIKKVDADTPDIVLLDLMMPIMDGEAFLRRFRKNPDFREIPILILTNLSREEAPKTIWHYGISGYFIKAHHTPKELENIIRELIPI
jgi:DNA-binding response OmpR family regulator